MTQPCSQSLFEIPRPTAPPAARPRVARTVLAAALAIALAGCSDGAEAPSSGAPNADGEARPAPRERSAEMAPPEACAYEGQPLAFADAPRVGGALRAGDGARFVDAIMRYTGLPQNFDVIPHPEVPNAAALIVADDTGTPRRVIAYNPAFIAQVAQATGDHNWAPISVMAHEIGHHLSGHTIRRGGSQPPVELEADQFSGFVLHKMGASLADAQRALNALVPLRGSATHPGRAERLSAVARGWREACRQLRDDCDGGTADPGARRPPLVAGGDDSDARRTAAPAGRLAPPDPDAPPAAQHQASAPESEAPAPPTVADRAGADGPAVDQLPRPDPDATPIKTTRFVWDELGLLDPATRAAHEHAMYEHAARHGVEIVTLVVADLHGLDAEAYALAMARQLRVGKLDVGNGAVLVVAPRQRQAAVFLGPGLALEMEGHDKTAQLARWIDYNAERCLTRGVCSAAETELLFGAADHLARSSRPWDWTVRYASFGAVHEAARRESEAIESYDPATSAVYRRLVRFEATVTALDPGSHQAGGHVRDPDDLGGRRAVRVDYGDGFHGVVYVDPAGERLMPAGALRPGRRYAMIGRVDALSGNRRDTQSFDVLSWDLAD